MEKTYTFGVKTEGKLLYSFPKLLLRIFVGFNTATNTQYWFEETFQLYTGRDSLLRAELEDIHAENTQLVPYFRGIKLDSIEDRTVALGKFKNACTAVFRWHENSFKTILLGSGFSKRGDGGNDASRGDLKLQLATLQKLCDTVMPMHRWIKGFMDTRHDPLFAKIFDGSPMTAYRKMVPMMQDPRDPNEVLDFIVDAYFREDWTTVAEGIQFAALERAFYIIKRVAPTVLRSVNELSLAQELAQLEIWANESEASVELVIKKYLKYLLVALQKAEFWGDNGFWRHVSVNSTLVDIKLALTDEQRSWWESAGIEAKQERIGQLWALVQSDRQYLVYDAASIKANFIQLIAHLQYENLPGLAMLEHLLDVFRHQMLRLAEFLDLKNFDPDEYDDLI